jgi:hypothetical protein
MFEPFRDRYFKFTLRDSARNQLYIYHNGGSPLERWPPDLSV